jgi:1-acyl-sn-glycerol-3-phosphate acyltransferase
LTRCPAAHIPVFVSDSVPPGRSLETLEAVAKGLAPRVRETLNEAEETIDHFLSGLMGESFDERIARIDVKLGAGGVDDFGLDPQWAKYGFFAAAVLYRHYFRCEVTGIENAPPGRVLFIGNHSGQVPIDAAMIGTALFLEADPPRMIRSMVEKWTQTLPFVSTFFSRVGQVVGVPENARRLLENDQALLVFPEGAAGISKTYDRAYQLTDFGLGFMRLAIETKTPIVPVAVVGAEEQYISIGNFDSVAKLLGMPALPIIPQLFVPGGQLPLPTKYRIAFGAPMHFDGDPDDDDSVLEEKVWSVKTTIQQMLNEGLTKRKGIFF